MFYYKYLKYSTIDQKNDLITKFNNISMKIIDKITKNVNFYSLKDDIDFSNLLLHCQKSPYVFSN